MPIEDLIAIAVVRIKAGALPCFKSSKQYGGKGHEEPCGVCQQPISEKEIGYEVEPDEPAPEDKAPLYLHITCHNAWVEACREVQP